MPWRAPGHDHSAFKAGPRCRLAYIVTNALQPTLVLGDAALLGLPAV